MLETYIDSQFMIRKAAIAARLYGTAGRSAQRFCIVILINVVSTQIRRTLRYKPGVTLLVRNLENKRFTYYLTRLTCR